MSSSVKTQLQLYILYRPDWATQQKKYFLVVCRNVRCVRKKYCDFVFLDCRFLTISLHV